MEDTSSFARNQHPTTPATKSARFPQNRSVQSSRGVTSCRMFLDDESYEIAAFSIPDVCDLDGHSHTPSE